MMPSKIVSREWTIGIFVMDIMGPLQNAVSGKQLVSVRTDLYSKPTSRGLECKTRALHIVSFSRTFGSFCTESLNMCFLNGTKFINKFFESLCAFLGTKCLKTTAYHLQWTREAECLKEMIIARLRHYVAENQRDWDIFMWPMTYVCKSWMYRCTNLTPISLGLSGLLC